MRCVFANPARNLAAHSDVIALLRGAKSYAWPMRAFMILLCSFLLLATLLGLAHPERSSQGVQAEALQSVPLVPDNLCGEGSGHGTCQLVVGGQPLPFSLKAVAGSSHFEITPVVADGRSLAPRTPPPRHLV